MPAVKGLILPCDVNLIGTHTFGIISTILLVPLNALNKMLRHVIVVPADAIRIDEAFVI
jgi:hypothetical protein